MLSSSTNDPHEIARQLGVSQSDDAPFALPSDVDSCLLHRHSQQLCNREKRAREFHAGRWCAANVLKAMKVAGDVGVAADRSPVWPNGVVGSLSHSEHFVWCLAGNANSYVSIGIDTEPIVDESTLRHLKYEILSDEEEQLGLAMGLNQLEAFTAIFSAKESFYKCAYQVQPVFIGFHDVEVVSFDSQTINLQMTPDSPNQLKSLRTMQVEYVVQSQDVFTACWLR